MPCACVWTSWSIEGVDHLVHTMPKPPWETLEPKKKQKLLQAAMKEFGAHGYELASINRILEAAEFSKSSFYYAFEDKEDLAATVFLEAAQPEQWADFLGEPSSKETFWDELRRMSLAQLRQLESQRLEYECIIRLSNALATAPSLAARVMPRFAPGRLKMAAFLERGVALGALRSDLPLGTLMAVIESVKRTAYASLFPGDRVPTEAEMHSFSELVIDLAKRISAPPKEG